MVDAKSEIRQRSLLPLAVLALCSLAGSKGSAHAAQVAAPASMVGRYIDVSDPPPFVRPQALRQDPSRTALGDQECPKFVFRNGFESGALVQAGGPGTAMQFTTSAGYVIRIDKHTITIEDPYAFNAVQNWGDPHENLNGKHVKDWGGMPGWDGKWRTVLLGGGAKVTMEASGPTGVVQHTSIYDTNQNVHFENTSNLILHHGVDAVETALQDGAQHDGETARFQTDPMTAIALYDNVYNEDDAFVMTTFDVPIGSTGGCANPNQVNDYFP